MFESGTRVAAVVFGSAVAVACSGPSSESPSQAVPQVGDQAPLFSLPSAEGPAVSLAEFRGESPVLLYFSMGPG